MTKSVKFDENGRRSEVEVQVSTLNSLGLTQIATWDTENGITKIESGIPAPASEDSTVASLRNRTFIVLTALVAPYGMLKDSSVLLTGNERFEGFGIDIIQELSLILGFKYEFELQEDKVYGGIDKNTGEWTGMIRRLQEGVSWNSFRFQHVCVCEINEIVLFPSECPFGHMRFYDYVGTRERRGLHNAVHEFR